MHKALLVTLLFVWQMNENIFAETNERNTGEFDVSIERAPHYVQIIEEDDVKCGGSILRREVVLTAGHCMFKDETLTTPLSPKDIQVIAGSDRKLEGTRIGINAISVHPHFINPTDTVFNDVALLFLKKPLIYSNQIQPIPIVKSLTPPIPEGANVFVVGFGHYWYYSQPEHLQGIYLSKANIQKCIKFLNSMGYKEYSTHICLGNLTIKGKYSCDGDSGGSATYKGLLYATVSYGHGCGLYGYPGAYANLITLNGWIRQAAKDMGFPIP